MSFTNILDCEVFLLVFISKLSRCSCAQQPNILLIVADDYGWNDIGYHGSEIRTPNLDKLAAGGVKLENYYVQPSCTPSRSQLLSGRYQIHTGLQHGVIRPPQPSCLPLSESTIVDILKASGYSTHIVGKWHLGFYKKECTPTYRGFDSYFGYLEGAEDYFNHSRCFSFDDKEFCGLDLYENEQVVRHYNRIYSTFLFSSKVQSIVDKRANEKKPLFMYLPFQAVHGPLQVPMQYEKPYKYIQNEERRKYAGMVSAMDEAVGDIVDTYKRVGLWNNTVLIFTTDNGGQVHKGGNNWPLRGYKGTLWEGGIRAVGFVHSPLIHKKNVINKDLIHISDWFPTIANISGIDLEDGLKLDGFNVWPTISMGLPSPRTEILHNIDPLTNSPGNAMHNSAFDIRVQAAIRKGDWKLLTGNPGDGRWVMPPSAIYHNSTFIGKLNSDSQNVWLFNITADPSENNDLSQAHPDIVSELLKRLSFYNATAVPVHHPPMDPKSDPALHGGVWGPWIDESSVFDNNWFHFTILNHSMPYKYIACIVFISFIIYYLIFKILKRR